MTETLQWKVHTTQLFEEILRTPGAGSNRDQLVRELEDFDAVALTMIHEEDFPLARVDTAERWNRKLRFAHHQGKES